MHLELLIPPRLPYACPKCGETVRSVERTTGGIIILNVDPSPDGEWVPWPSSTMNGLAQARQLPKPVLGEDRWSEHACR